MTLMTFTSHPPFLSFSEYWKGITLLGLGMAAILGGVTEDDLDLFDGAIKLNFLVQSYILSGWKPEGSFLSPMLPHARRGGQCDTMSWGNVAHCTKFFKVKG